MIRFAVPPIGGKGWFGGWMYMRNLVRTLAQYGDPEIETVLFVGTDRAGNSDIRDLAALPRTRVVADPAFDENKVRGGLARTLLTGRNEPLLAAYRRERIDVAFSPAIYLGWRSEIPSIAWIPDFQHRRMPHLFSRRAWWRRDLGFRAQIAASAGILLSSHDAEADCNEFYPAARGRTHVARFSVPMDSWPDPACALEMLHKSGIPKDFVFLPNQLWVHKNHMLAVEAAAILKASDSTRTIVVTGHGVDPRRPNYAAELRQAVQDRGAESHFRFLGSVDHDLIKALTLGANALLNPSRFEGWSTTVEEAKACGTPLILSDIRVHREQAPDAKFFDPDDAETLARAIGDSPPRTMEQIAAALFGARKDARERQAEFGQKLSMLIHAVRTGMGPR